MSVIERRQEFRPASGEAPFSLDEVFFSRTDDRGVIQAGNYVFRRVAHYDWAALIGAPHKIIRHPDMPRGVFWLFWDMLKRGETVGAYVKNRASDGLYYWVYASVAPIPDGYISARIKPTSLLFPRIEEEYRLLRLAEEREGLSPEESGQRLLARLRDLGFDDYAAFAATSLRTEMQTRDVGLGRNPADRDACLTEMLTAADALGTETRALVQQFGATRTIPHNMRVIGSRLEPTGGPISVLAKNYAAISAEMSGWFEQNVVGPDSNFATIKSSVNNAMFLEGLTRVLYECDVQLSKERRRLGDIDMETERGKLRDLVQNQTRMARESIDQVRDEAERISRACDTMDRHMLELSSTRVLCKIESARLPNSGDALEDIIQQLKQFQEQIGARLERISQCSNRILTLCGR